MTVFVFAGPTVPAKEIAMVIDAVVLPPVSMGDVYRCGTERPRAIGIIDGYFEGVPSVWHKEILWAMDQGIAVFGAASMGALRAAELHSFGMRGVGKIFEAYRNGLLEDDDEVAMHHGPAETGYIPLSEPMVNIRATLDHALQEKILGSEIAERLAALAKANFYPERNWRALLAQAADEGLQTEELQALEAWLRRGRVDRKRQDALAMLEAMNQYLREENPAAASGFHLEWTTMWDSAKRRIETMDAGSRPSSAIIDELRLDPDRFRQVRRSAMARFLAGRTGGTGEARRAGGPDVARATASFRSKRGLFTKAALDRWLAENDLDADGFERLIGGELRLAMIEAEFAGALDCPMLDELRLGDAYVELARRAGQKHELLHRLGMPDPTPAQAGAHALELRLWFFETRLRRPAPDDIDRFLEEAGYPDRESFDRMLAREYIFWGADGKQ